MGPTPLVLNGVGPTMLLSDALIRKAQPGLTPTKLYDAKGLFILITPSGNKWWRFKYRFGGKEKLLSAGVFPDVSLSQARKRRDTFRALLAEGIDPSEQSKSKRAQKLADDARQLAATRFTIDNNGALSFRLGNRRLTLTPVETAELRVFLNATRGITPTVTSCP